MPNTATVDRACEIRNSYVAPGWTRAVLFAAAAYNLLWGTAVILLPATSLQMLGLEADAAPLAFLALWQCVGMLVGVYGVAYAIAASNPARHWPLVLVGLLGKVLGPLGFLFAAIQGHLPWSFGATLLVNDLLWWLPFAAILVHAARYHSNSSRGVARLSFEEAIDSIESHRGRTLAELSQEAPVLVVFLRHAGCTFCREALADLARHRAELEATGTRLAFVHLDDLKHGAELARKYDVDDVHRFSDPSCQLYEAFGLQRGTLGQLFGPTVMRRAIPALLAGNGLGMLRGDGFRMPGAFVLDHGEIVEAYRHNTAGDRPDYVQLVEAANRKLAPAVGA